MEHRIVCLPVKERCYGWLHWGSNTWAEFQRKNEIVRVNKRKDYLRRETKRVKWAWKNDYASEHFQLPLTEIELEWKSTEARFQEWLAPVAQMMSPRLNIVFFLLLDSATVSKQLLSYRQPQKFQKSSEYASHWKNLEYVSITFTYHYEQENEICWLVKAGFHVHLQSCNHTGWTRSEKKRLSKGKIGVSKTGRSSKCLSYREQIILVIFKCNAQDIDEQLADLDEGQRRRWNDTRIQVWASGYDVGTK